MEERKLAIGPWFAFIYTYTHARARARARAHTHTHTHTHTIKVHIIINDTNIVKKFFIVFIFVESIHHILLLINN